MPGRDGNGTDDDTPYHTKISTMERAMWLLVLLAAAAASFLAGGKSENNVPQLRFL
jgi:hypothetical protein